MWSYDERQRVLKLLHKQLGKPYAIGSKVDGKWVVQGKPQITDTDPKDFDCSGFSRWAIAQGLCQCGNRIVLPHGTKFQIKKCSPLTTEAPRPLDLGFGDMDCKDGVDHVIVRFSSLLVIEARGPQEGRDYGKVILRPVSAWEKYKGFMGWWRVPGIYDCA